MDNASGLIADAHALLERGPFGRARSLTVLAQDELGKALWIYEGFEQAWSTGSEVARYGSRMRAMPPLGEPADRSRSGRRAAWFDSR